MIAGAWRALDVAARRAPKAALLALTLLLFPWSPASAEPSAESAPAVGADPGAPEAQAPYLWVVEGDAGRSFLFGTIHVGVGISDLDPAVGAALDEATRSVFEADVRTINPLTVFQMAQYPEGASLADDLSEEQLAEVLDAAGSTLPRDALVRMRPWFVMTVLLNELVGGTVPVDLQLLQRAESQGDTIGFLESWRDQLEAFARVPQDYAVASVVEMAADPDAIRAELERMVAAYLASEDAVLEALVQSPEDREAYPEFFEALLSERNLAWVEPLEGHFTRGGAFVAVGVGHLLGEGSVIALLEARGWNISRVRGPLPSPG